MTRRSLKPNQPLLVGTLFIYERSSIRSKPVLGLEVNCPYCHDRRHVHGWNAGARLDEVTHRAAHCVAGSPLEPGYFVGLDPTHKKANKQVLAEFAELMAGWESRQCTELQVVS